MKKLILILLLPVFVIISCRKDGPSSSIKSQAPLFNWSEYIGTYDVFDTISHTQWVMKVTHIGQHSNYNNGNCDSILIENFANKFTIRDTWNAGLDVTLNQPAFFIKIYHPIIDKYGHSWHLGGDADDTTTARHENVLINDTVVIYFKQSNIAYYVSEGQPYFACDCKHIAVKRPN